MASEAVRLGRDRCDAVVSLLCAAFRDYPVMRYILKDAGDAYDARLAALVGYFTEMRFACGYPVLGVPDPDGPGLIASANVNPPRTVPAPPSLKRRFETLRGQLGEPAIARFHAFAAACGPLEPEAPHYYLGMVGVAPGRQGRGYARIVLDTVHAMSTEDPESTGVCLTTETPGNIALYEHFGYRVLGRAVTEDGELETWTMFRED